MSEKIEPAMLRVREVISAKLTDGQWLALSDTEAKEIAGSITDALARRGLVVMDYAVARAAQEARQGGPSPQGQRRIERFEYEIRCTCPTLHNHCLGSECVCPRHAEEIGQTY